MGFKPIDVTVLHGGRKVRVTAGAIVEPEQEVEAEPEEEEAEEPVKPTSKKKSEGDDE